MWTARIGRNGPKLLDRAEADPVRLAQGSVDGSGFGNAQLSPVDHEGNIGRISVTVTDETFRTRGFVDRCFEDPAASNRVTEVANLFDPNAIAATACCQAQEASMGDVPPALEKKEIAKSDRKSVVFGERPENL
jgi:hypothetical protein